MVGAYLLETSTLDLADINVQTWDPVETGAHSAPVALGWVVCFLTGLEGGESAGMLQALVK